MKQQKIQPNSPGRYNSQPYKCPLPEEVPLKLNRKRVERYLVSKGTTILADKEDVLAALKTAPRHIREAALGIDG